MKSMDRIVSTLTDLNRLIFMSCWWTLTKHENIGKILLRNITQSYTNCTKPVRYQLPSHATEQLPEQQITWFNWNKIPHHNYLNWAKRKYHRVDVVKMLDDSNIHLLFGERISDKCENINLPATQTRSKKSTTPKKLHRNALNHLHCESTLRTIVTSRETSLNYL